MKRSSDDDDRGASSSESRAEEFLTRFLKRHPRLLAYVGAGFAALVVVVVLVVVFTRNSQ